MSIVQARAPVVWRPQPRQAEFMSRPEPEALYGGAAGGGKSDALVIEALRQVHIPHYRALILRKTYPQLSDLVDKSQVYYHRRSRRHSTTPRPMCGTSPAGQKFTLAPCSTLRTVPIIRARPSILSVLTS